MEWLHRFFTHAPEAALFLSLAIGYAIGRIQIGKFTLGGVGGSLLVAVALSQVGVQVDNGVKAVMFALFIYAVGYESGPQFFNSLNRAAVKEIVLALFIAIAGLATTVILARLCHLDKGLAAGIAAGGLTQSAIIGTAGDAISRIGLSPDEVRTLQANVAIGYAVTYIFGSLGAILVCVNLLERVMGRTIREDAKRKEAEQTAGSRVFGRDEVAAAPAIVGRAYAVDAGAGRTVRDVESGAGLGITVERIRRGGRPIDVAPDVTLMAGDRVLLVGRREAMVTAASTIGRELPHGDGVNDAAVKVREVVFTRKGVNRITFKDLRDRAGADLRRGVYLAGVKRMGNALDLSDDTIFEHGDVFELYGAPDDVQRVADALGYTIPPGDKTDFIYLGLGLVVGILIGWVTLRVGGIPLTLGSGGGALLAGLVFGWLRAKHPTFGAMPTGAVQILKDFGLAAFVAVVGLNAGLQAVDTLRQSGVLIFVLGVLVTTVPLILGLFFGKYVLGYTNAAVFAGALAGSRSANPAFGEVLNKAESAVPTVPFALTYALANVLLTLLGPLIVALV